MEERNLRADPGQVAPLDLALASRGVPAGGTETGGGGGGNGRGSAHHESQNRWPYR